MNRWGEWYARFEDYLSGLLLISGLGLLFVGVVMRYVFQSPVSWIYEIAGYLVVWGTLIGAAVALREGHHIQVDVLYDRVPNGVKKMFNIFSDLLGILFCILFVYWSIQILQMYHSIDMRSNDTGIPLWFVYLALPISGVMLGIRFVTNLIKHAKGEVG